MYRPNFCAECGTRVERARWHFWSSRRFCPSCAGRLQRKQILSTALILVAFFSFGLVAGRFRRPAPPPLIVERGQSPSTPAPAAAKAGTESTDSGTGADAAQAPSPGHGYGPDGTANERPTDPGETVSICGARTQKGTPCQRRVRGTGRCWQHRGMPAITRNTIVK